MTFYHLLWVHSHHLNKPLGSHVSEINCWDFIFLLTFIHEHVEKSIKNDRTLFFTEAVFTHFPALLYLIFLNFWDLWPQLHNQQQQQGEQGLSSLVPYFWRMCELKCQLHKMETQQWFIVAASRFQMFSYRCLMLRPLAVLHNVGRINHNQCNQCYKHPKCMIQFKYCIYLSSFIIITTVFHISAINVPELHNLETRVFFKWLSL